MQFCLCTVYSSASVEFGHLKAPEEEKDYYSMKETKETVQTTRQKTWYNCEFCGFKSDEKPTVADHESKEHNFPPSIRVADRWLVKFESEDAAKEWLKVTAEDFEESRVCWTRPGWYLLKEDFGEYSALIMVDIEYAVEDMTEDVKIKSKEVSDMKKFLKEIKTLMEEKKL